MSRTKPTAMALMGSSDDVEAQFYEALRDGDIERLMALWSDEDEVVCVLPGGVRVCGPAAVRARFEAAFATGPIPAHPERVRRLLGVGHAVHSVLERIEVPGKAGPDSSSTWAVATNVYVQTARGWRLAAHHVSPCALDEPVEAASSAGTLH